MFNEMKDDEFVAYAKNVAEYGPMKTMPKVINELIHRLDKNKKKFTNLRALYKRMA